MLGVNGLFAYKLNWGIGGGGIEEKSILLNPEVADGT